MNLILLILSVFWLASEIVVAGFRRSKIVSLFAVFLYRIKIEEAVLLAAFGEEYASYCRKTKRLIPGAF